MSTSTPSARRIPELNDAQKGDLSLLWERHAPRHALSSGIDSNAAAPPRGGGGRGSRGRGRGGGKNEGNNKGGVAPTTIVTMALEDDDYEFICRLYSFIRSSATLDANSDKMQQYKTTRQSLSFLFQGAKQLQQQQTSNNTNFASNTHAMIMTPKIIGGNQIITFDNTSFLQEFNSHEQQHHHQVEGNNYSSFGTYLHQCPDRALASLGCAIGLYILTLWRRHQALASTSSNPLLRNNNGNNNLHPHLLTLHTAIYQPRFYNLPPSSQIRMANIRTSTVGCLISLRGVVTKARPKRLRVLDVGFVCTKCGLHQITPFMDGKYTTPVRCGDIKCRSSKFVLNRKVANFCDVQELKIQEVREEFCEDLLMLESNNHDEGGSGRDAGRAPRHMEVEVANDLVGQCHAGDSIVVVGIVRAVNSALASGRVGKRAVETSTYKLYVVAHSIVNFMSDDLSRAGPQHGRGKRNWNDFDTGDGQDGSGNKRQKSSSSNMQYTDQQLQNIANLAHADHRMYSMPTRMAFPFDLLVRSLCPNIIGHDLVKAGIILCLLGGTPPEVSGLEARSGMTIRSNSHMLIVGDPG